ncbi:phage tail sheath family protein [Oculatella sp. LEGE 06141]|uniref:phage tail sheath family protein n=1 Tax=Oculatella sp. LEGE 06141 TaxID=1828648 RepID=UPI0018826898|nr:phage tail sheath C-terminal domain-containing protein [Oculatella sp. LEGE 06141]MBE9180876.1 phage tail sheath family protein [Oculatella sp. LEGE 06141]
MPTLPNYPGVYIEEIPSGVRTITGVATSITAFVGRARRGLANEPVTINSYAEFERLFGGLWVDSTMSYAVRDFYLNGGSQALIVRVHNNAASAVFDFEGGLGLEAASGGTWGNKLSAVVDHQTRDADSTDPPPDPNLFNLTIVEQDGAIEKFLNVSIDPTDPRYLPRVLEQSSLLVRVRKNEDDTWMIPEARPGETGETPVTASNGSDGDPITPAQFTGEGMEDAKTGIFALKKADLFNLLCLPPLQRGGDMPTEVYQAALPFCVKQRAMLIVDSPSEWSANKAMAATTARNGLSGLGLSGTDARNAAIYFPRVLQVDPLRDRQVETFVPCGIIAGIMARTDAQRGVWKAPAGLDAAINGIQGLEVNLSDPENGMLNPLGINCLRSFPVSGRVVWGARTLRGADQLADEYKYIPVRRLTLFLQESLYRGTQWVVFEPNDEPLWAQVRLNIGAFMQNLFRQGAFQGQSPRDAYFVKCDKETTTQTDINLGIVNIIVGFAPLKPAEFVIIKFQQIAGQIAT